MRVRLSDSQPRHCRWIDGEDMRNPLCCGKKTLTGYSLCAEHKKLAYKPLQPKPKATEPIAFRHAWPYRS